MVLYTSCCRDVLYFTDGKPWKMAKPGTGDGFAGARVQHVLQADGLCYSFTCPLCCHDAMVLQEYSMFTMLSVLHVNNDPLHPVKYVSDKAYSRTRHLRPLHTTLELCLMAPQECEIAEEEDSRNKGPRNGVEMSFKNIVLKFTHRDYFPNHCVLQSGRCYWPYLRQLWDLQVLFFNLFTCSEGMGKPINGMFDISPPTVEECVYSANNNLLIPLPAAPDEDDNSREEADVNRLFYHLPN